MGILCAGHVVFPISPRNSPAAVEDLLRKTKCAHIFLSQDAHVTGVVRDALADLGGVSQHTMPQFRDLYPAQDAHEVADALETPTYGPESLAIILHSSGKHGSGHLSCGVALSRGG